VVLVVVPAARVDVPEKERESTKQEMREEGVKGKG
jgi:hypothetical protein